MATIKKLIVYAIFGLFLIGFGIGGFSAMNELVVHQPTEQQIKADNRIATYDQEVNTCAQPGENSGSDVNYPTQQECEDAFGFVLDDGR